MVIMALDHVRAYFYHGLFYNDPTDLDTTTVALFFTRFITHYCAPVFVFLAGTSAYLYGGKKSKGELFKFLFTRGIWLIVLEIVVNNFIWTFDWTYSMQIFQVIWVIGLSMVCLSFMIYLPRYVILALGLLFVAGHNLLDAIVLEGSSWQAVTWYILHQKYYLTNGIDQMKVFNYALIPWLGVMSLGYVFGTIYQKNYNAVDRKKWLLRLGLGALVVFFALRTFNIYGDPAPWTPQETTAFSILSFFNVTKYAPSLLFLCITLGPAILFLSAIEKTKNKITDFLLVFGRVPLFYYFLHMIVIHLLAIVVLLCVGGDWHDMVFNASHFISGKMANYGYPLYLVYILWIVIVLALYPVCKRYMLYKKNNRDKWWLSYL